MYLLFRLFISCWLECKCVKCVVCIWGLVHLKRIEKHHRANNGGLREEVIEWIFWQRVVRGTKQKSILRAIYVLKTLSLSYFLFCLKGYYCYWFLCCFVLKKVCKLCGLLYSCRLKATHEFGNLYIRVYVH